MSGIKDLWAGKMPDQMGVSFARLNSHLETADLSTDTCLFCNTVIEAMSTCDKCPNCGRSMCEE